MSDINPYATPQTISTDIPGNTSIRKVFTNPIDLIKRAYELVKDRYGLFLGVTLVGLLLGSLVPFYIILGPMMIGIFYCYIQHESGKGFEFSDLFKGFDQFLNGFIVMLVLLVASLVLMTPLFVLLIIGIVNASGEPPVGIMILFYLGALLVSFVLYIPFLFVFQLMAEHKLQPMDAIKLSMKGSFANLGSVVVNMLCLMFVSLLLAMMCYLPALLFLPVSFGAMFLLYRDIYGRPA